MSLRRNGRHLAGLVGVLVAHAQPVTLDLGGLWGLRNDNGSIRLNATVPGMVHTDLLAAGVIGEPYHQYNDRDLAWIIADNWTYTREFTPPPGILGSSHSRLVFEGLSTIASVFLNGVLVLSTSNQFVTWIVATDGMLRPGANSLTVAFTSSTLYAAAADHAYNMSTHNITSWVVCETDAGRRAPLRFTSTRDDAIAGVPILRSMAFAIEISSGRWAHIDCGCTSGARGQPSPAPLDRPLAHFRGTGLLPLLPTAFISLSFLKGTKVPLSAP